MEEVAYNDKTNQKKSKKGVLKGFSKVFFIFTIKLP